MPNNNFLFETNLLSNLDYNPESMVEEALTRGVCMVNKGSSHYPKELCPRYLGSSKSKTL